jgi:SAM-dependent methyltransferase
MQIDMQRVTSIASRYAALDPLEAYYLGKLHIRPDPRNVLPEAQDVLAKALHGAGRVLDVGCGDGHTLITNATSFQDGFGVDESDYIVGRATASARTARVTNVKFQFAKAIALPFPDNHFDLVFSERGPVGHADSTLIEVDFPRFRGQRDMPLAHRVAPVFGGVFRYDPAPESRSTARYERRFLLAPPL